MEIRNLEKNILYRICEEMTQGHHCGPVDTRLIYRTYVDLPSEKVAASIRSLVRKGWLRDEQNMTKLYLTDHGRSEIRSLIPAQLLPTCDPPQGCKEH